MIPGEPHAITRRLIAQAGTFVVPGLLDHSIDEILGAYPSTGSTVTKFVLRSSVLRSEAMLALYKMNVTNANLFPDLDGLARSMVDELEFHLGYDPKRMEVRPG